MGQRGGSNLPPDELGARLGRTVGVRPVRVVPTAGLLPMAELHRQVKLQGGTIVTERTIARLAAIQERERAELRTLRSNLRAADDEIERLRRGRRGSWLAGVNAAWRRFWR